jgi:LuxR family maltose regulon positive regulatory protein
MTLVQGPLGYGKSTLMVGWLESESAKEIKVVWVTGRPGLGGGREFEEYLSRSLLAEGLNSVEALSEESAPSGLAELGRVLLAASVDTPFVMVIDNFHEIHDERILKELVDLVGRYRHFHLYVCCEGRHPMEKLVAGSFKMHVIEPKELLLDAAEIVDLARVMGSPVDKSLALTLLELTGGWMSIVGLALASGDDAAKWSAIAQAYLRDSVFSSVRDQTLYGQIMQFSLADSLPSGLVREFCDGSDPDQFLETLESTGMFERVFDGGEEVLKIPVLIRGFLRDSYVTRDPEGAKAFHRRLARWFVEFHDDRYAQLAFSHAVKGEDWELMDKVWSTYGLMFSLPHFELIHETLNDLSADVLATRPVMQMTLRVFNTAVGDKAANGLATREYINICEGIIRKQLNDLSSADLLFIGTGYMQALRVAGRYQDSADFADRLHNNVAASVATGKIANGNLAWFHDQRGCNYVFLNDQRSAMRSYEQAWRYCAGSTDQYIPSHVAGLLAFTYAMQGETQLAQVWQDRHRSFDIRHSPLGYLFGIPGHLAAAYLAMDRLDDRELHLELDYLGDWVGFLGWGPFIGFLRAQYALHRGRALEELAHLNQAALGPFDEPGDKSVLAAHLTRIRADLLIASGQGERALLFINDLGSDTPLLAVPTARIRVLAGKWDVQDIDLMMWESDLSSRDRLELLLLHATGALRLDHLANAAQLVGQALDLYRATGILGPFATIPRGDLARLLDLVDGCLEEGDAERLAERAPVYPERLTLVELSPRELLVLAALAEAPSRQVIADALFISVNTVKTELASIFRKFGTKTREETLTKAREKGFLTSSVG